MTKVVRAPRAKATSTRVRSWDLLNEKVKTQLPDMPQVQPLQVDLQSQLDQVRSLDNQQEQARSTLRDLTRQRRTAEQQGELVRRRIEAHLRGTYGFSAAQLISYGVKPRSTAPRRKAKTPPGTPAPGTTPTPAAKP